MEPGVRVDQPTQRGFTKSEGPDPEIGCNGVSICLVQSGGYDKKTQRYYAGDLFLPTPWRYRLGFGKQSKASLGFDV